MAAFGEAEAPLPKGAEETRTFIATKTPAMPRPTIAKPGAASRARSDGDLLLDLIPRVCGSRVAAASQGREAAGRGDRLCGASGGLRRGRSGSRGAFEPSHLGDDLFGLALLERARLERLEDEELSCRLIRIEKQIDHVRMRDLLRPSVQHLSILRNGPPNENG